MVKNYKVPDIAYYLLTVITLITISIYFILTTEPTDSLSLLTGYFLLTIGLVIIVFDFLKHTKEKTK